MTGNTVIVHGRRACGKTRNATLLQDHFGCVDVVDEWEPGMEIIPGYLHLTTWLYPGSLSFDDVMADIILGHNPMRGSAEPFDLDQLE